MQLEGWRKERLERGIKVRTDGVYAISSWREIGYLLFPRLLLIMGLLFLPICLPNVYWKRVISIVCIYSLVSFGFDLLANFVGLVSLGGAFFIGTGAYIAAIINTELGAPLYLTIPFATIAGAGICTLLLLPCLPLSGVYFAIVTLMYPLLCSRIIEALDILGGTEGIIGVASFPSLYLEQYLLISAVLFSLFGLRRLVNVEVGLVLRGIKDNDQAVKASGINITLYKSIALFIASGLGCLGGAFLAHIYMWAGISQFSLDLSILPIAATVIGGGGTFAGSLIGCFILVPISEMLRSLGTLRIVFYAIILMAFIVIRSEGLMIYARRKYHQFERWVMI